jgi:hypothetical protein
MPNALQRLGLPQSSINPGCRMENVYTAGHQNIKYSSAQNIHSPTSPKPLLLQDTENTSNTSAPLTGSHQKTCLPLSGSCSAGEAGRTRAWITVIWYQDVDGNISRNSTPSNFTTADGGLRQPDTTQVK